MVRVRGQPGRYVMAAADPAHLDPQQAAVDHICRGRRDFRNATARLTVFVGGQQVVRDGKALAFDYADASARLEMTQRRAIEKVPRFDWAGRSAAEIMPPTFPSG